MSDLAQQLQDAFADALAEHGETVILHASGGDQSVSGLLTLDQVSLSDDGPIRQTGTLKIKTTDETHLNLDGTVTTAVTARTKRWHIINVDNDAIGYIAIGLRITDDEINYSNITDMDDTQAAWTS